MPQFWCGVSLHDALLVLTIAKPTMPVEHRTQKLLSCVISLIFIVRCFFVVAEKNGFWEACPLSETDRNS